MLSNLRRPFLVLLILLATAACVQAGSTKPADVVGTVEFVESFPAETNLDLPDLRDAAVVWPQVIDAAESKIQVASFYYSRQGDGKDAGAPDGTPDKLLPSLEALANAANRRLNLQILADSKFMKNYPEVPTWLGGLDNAETRIFDVGPHWGGVLHAKYFLVDDDQLYVGSQNWDWRAMDQIHELGVLVTHPQLAADLGRVFDWDWALSESDPNPTSNPLITPRFADLPGVPLLTAAGDTVTGLVAASPPDGLPEGIAWDLPLIIEMIDSARDSVHLQLLSYGMTDREGRLFDDLDRALRRASVRRVKVRIILANWSKSKYKVPWIQSLAILPNVEIRFSNIPEYSKGFIPFARVEHAKYLTVDGNGCWIGTSNWSRDYFHSSRNVSLFFRGTGAAHDPDRFFNLSWHSPYVETVDPGAKYQPPRRN